MQPATKVALGITGGSMVLAVALCVVVASARKKESQRQEERQGEPAKEVQPEKRPMQAKQEYPYPECAACMRWMKENIGDADSIQIIEWSRQQLDRSKPPGIAAKYRFRTSRGGWRVDIRVFYLKEDGSVRNTLVWGPGREPRVE